ncbi:TetR/AcrR family transcriptional regulator [Catellatospora bangladeshensis]|uniref:TetR family transcriptional regulator n=1 Tax=Catellatospora bangladeshensis TaxID=310355 RepID=A0A8J3NHC6_9ACTN|nr:TetR/AcrR family transcriptional regulator [Catellatospora bangladeshensis]GIF81102.1 TetR family transcriptional regulator [Catellatospora bangladeshensis]
MTAKPSAARERLLAAAARTFYAEGIHAVGVDRVIEQAQVTRATFYRHFPGKDDLVRAYVEAADADIRARLAAAQAVTADPYRLLGLCVEGIGEDICAPGFRGCPFINAAAEFPDPDHPVHRAVVTHRAWFRDALAGLLTTIGYADPQLGADTLVMLRDGAMVAGYLGSPDAARANLRAAASAMFPRPDGGADVG